jgi:pentatricopeptide repeat protein
LANEALELDEKDAKAAALYRHVLYTLHPKKRLLDKAKALHEEADGCMKEGDYNKALELFSLAKKWHCTPGVLLTRAKANNQ